MAWKNAEFDFHGVELFAPQGKTTGGDMGGGERMGLQEGEGGENRVDGAGGGRIRWRGRSGRPNERVVGTGGRTF